jgi:translation initiation factor 2 gamma subunit (eIF-2gamma)
MEVQQAKFRSALSPDLDVKVKPLRTGAPVLIGVGPRTAVGVVMKIMSLPMLRITHRGKKM